MATIDLDRYFELSLLRDDFQCLQGLREAKKRKSRESSSIKKVEKDRATSTLVHDLKQGNKAQVGSGLMWNWT